MVEISRFKQREWSSARPCAVAQGKLQPASRFGFGANSAGPGVPVCAEVTEITIEFQSIKLAPLGLPPTIVPLDLLVNYG